MSPGPTVVQAALARVRQIDLEIKALRLEKAACLRRAFEYQGTKVLEEDRCNSRTDPATTSDRPSSPQ